MCHQKYETQELYMHRMLHVNPTVTTKKKLIVNTQKKMRKGSKYNTKENNQNTREERKKVIIREGTFRFQRWNEIGRAHV